MPLQAPVMNVNRSHLQQRGAAVIQWVVATLRAAGIVATIRPAVGPGGRPTLLVYTKQVDEAYLTLPPVVGGFLVKVV